MKKLNLTISFGIILALAVPVLAYEPQAAGPGSSGGGKGVVCRDHTDGSITSVELLDFYEGRAFYGVNPILSSAPPEEQAREQINKFRNNSHHGNNPTLYNVDGFLENVIRFLHPTPEGTGLTPVDDSFEVIVPKNCKVEQLASYITDRKILVDGELWSKMDATNKAGLLLHEAVYKSLRFHSGAKDSIRTRRIVSHVFSGMVFEDVHEGVPGKEVDVKVCWDKDSAKRNFHFYAYPQGDQTRLQFLILGSQPVLSKKFADIPIRFEDFPLDNKNWEKYDGIFVRGDTISNFESDDDIVIEHCDSQPPNDYRCDFDRRWISVYLSSYPETSVREVNFECFSYWGPNRGR